MTKQNLATLNGVRGIAAIAVVTAHWDPDIFGSFRAQSGFLAVDLFFLLSGVVIAHAYDQRFRKGLPAAEFLKMRYVRLFPLYAVGVALSLLTLALLAVLGRETSPAGIELFWSLLFNGLMLPTPMIGTFGQPFPLNRPAWTLLYELLANLFYVLLFRFSSLRNLVLLAGFSGAALLAMVVAAGTLDFGWFYVHAVAALFRVAFPFTLGIIFSRLYEAGALPNLRMPRGVPLLAAAVLLWVRPDTPYGLYDIACAFLLFPLLVLTALPQSGGRLAPACDWLGRISYPIYAIHAPLLPLIGLGAGRLFEVPGEVLGFATLGLLLWLGGFLDRFYDAPARKQLAPIVQGARPHRARRGETAA
jgi:peptidoglycan/LPS O-acetylase OafA/YrhL